MQDIAAALHLDGTTMVGRFLSLRRLPESIQERVVWGRSKDSLNLTQGQEIARLPNQDDQLLVADAAVDQQMTASELRSVAQLVRNSHDSASRAVEKTLALRPQMERRYVTVGQIVDAGVRQSLSALSPQRRSELVRQALPPDILSATLSPTHFTVTTQESLTQSADELESVVNDCLARLLELES